MNVLLVEDEVRIAGFVADGLRAEHHSVEVADALENARTFLESMKEFDVVILDRMLDDKDGTTLIPIIKQKSPDTAVLILSAISSAEEKAKVLDQGADDYLSKPFSLVELSARLRSLVRRPRNTGSQTLKLKQCEVDLIHHTVSVRGSTIELSAKEFQLFLTFAQQPGRVYNKFQLLSKVWETQHDIESNVVEVTVNNLRRKLESAMSGIAILSKRNVGYWIEA